MIKIRLSRGGRKNVPFYRFVATNSTSPRDSKFLEKLGTYNPLANDSDEKKIIINKERVEHWLSVGAQPTERVAKFLIALGVKGAEKHKPNFKPKKKGDSLKKKALEKLKAAKEAADAAKAEEASAAESAAPATEAAAS
jgi:small subunit ribosomal protein S16